MKRLVVLGAGGHGAVVADAAECQGLWSEIIFLDDGWATKKNIYSWPVLGALDKFANFINSETSFVVAIGNAQVRLEWLKKIQDLSGNIATIIHPSAVISRHAQIGAGVVVFANAVVNIGAYIAVGCIINTGAGVDHDVKLAECVHICPNTHLAGNVKIGSCSWIGIGTSVRQMIEIGSNVMVGAGSVIVSNVGNNMTVMGVPAKPKAFN